MRNFGFAFVIGTLCLTPHAAFADAKAEEVGIKGDITITGKLTFDAKEKKDANHLITAGLNTVFVLEFAKADLAADAGKLDGKNATLKGKLNGKLREDDRGKLRTVMVVETIKDAGDAQHNASGTWEMQGVLTNKKVGFASGDVDGNLAGAGDGVHLFYDGKKAIAETAAKFDGKPVIVTGKYEIRAAGTRSETRVLTVTKIAEAK